MELFAADGHDAGGCERVTGKSGMRPTTPLRIGQVKELPPPEPAAAHVAPFSAVCLNAFRFRRRPSRIPALARLVPDASFNLGRSRVRESRSLGSLGAKAEWLSYPTIPQ